MSGLSSDEDQSSDDERERERYGELLQELRTVIPGVQVLFAFLLTAPFSSRFGDLDNLGRDVYLGVLVAVAVASVLFVTPTAFHRLAERSDRRARLQLGIKCTVAGMILLGGSMAAAVFVVTRFVFGDTLLAVLPAGVVTVSIIGMWILVPLRDRLTS